MILLTLIREPNPTATPGSLYIYGTKECDTLERPWMDNKRGISCIPPGKYPVIMTVSPRFGRPMMRLAETAPRWGILIHAANHVDELQGCIALGKRVRVDTLMESRKAVAKVEQLVREALAQDIKVWIEILNPKAVA